MTTNHIAKALTISPGNLYFHYDNKEEILRELFRRMSKETYEVWRPQRKGKEVSLRFIDENFELYWKYRFFHREMYALRRKDPTLARMWRAHISKMMTLMQVLYRRWVREGHMTDIKDKAELLYVSESLLAMATTFLQFFESAEKQPGKRSVERGKRHVARLLMPYAIAQTRDELENFISSTP